MTHYHDAICTDRVAIRHWRLAGCRPVGCAHAREPGYAVVVGYIRDQGAADSIVEEVLAAGGTTLTIPRRSRRRARLERMFAETTEAFGGIDILVHAAGLIIRDPVAEYDLDRFDALQRTNVGGTFLVNRQTARHLRDGGTIVNLAGSAVGSTLPIDAASAASSAAMEAMTRVLAGELRGRHITVNAVAPGLENPGDPAVIADIRHSSSATTAAASTARSSGSTEGPSEDQATLEYLRVRSRAHAPRAEATEQWESPPPEERTARTRRYHGVQEADQGHAQTFQHGQPEGREERLLVARAAA